MSDQDYKEFHAGAGIFVRQSDPEGMRVGNPVLGHRHNFDHVTFVTRGVIEVALLEADEVNAYGHPLNARIVESRVISAEDQCNWFFVLKGKFHTLTALVDGSRYQCTYAARLPQAITEHMPGDQKQLPLMKRDENGVLWYREDPRIVETSEWAEAYR